jgi:hypothetical protein
MDNHIDNGAEPPSAGVLSQSPGMASVEPLKSDPGSTHNPTAAVRRRLNAAARSGLIALLALFVALGVAIVPAQAASAPDPSQICLGCHGDKSFSIQQGGKTVSLYVDGKKFAHSIHADLSCTGCHSDLDPNKLPHGKPKQVNCADCHTDEGEQYATSIHGVAAANGNGKAPHCWDCHGNHDIVPVSQKKPAVCADCHTQVGHIYDTSIHGKLHAEGNAVAPYCTDCHGAHHILAKNDPQAPIYPLNVPNLCAGCHREGQKAAVRYKGNEHEIVQNYAESIHGKGLTKAGLVVTATCVSCHSAHHELPASDPNSSVNPANVPNTCGACHVGIEEQFNKSIHSPLVTKTDKTLPVCSTCHTAHRIQRTDEVGFRLETMTVCGNCHHDQADTYFDTYHGKVSKLGYSKTAKCWDCHGGHDILPVSNPNSTLSPKNKVATCRKCHSDATKQFASYLAHATPHNRKKYPELYIAFWGMTGLLVVTFLVAGLHTLLWLPRSFQMRRELHELEERENAEDAAMEAEAAERAKREKRGEKDV